MDCQKLIEAGNFLKEKIREFNRELLNKFPKEKYLDYLKSYPRISIYGYVSPEVRSFCKDLVDESSEYVLELYHKLILVELMIHALADFKFQNLPNDIKELYEINFERILKEICSGQFAGYYNYSHDKFKKEIALCNLKLIPAGAQKVNLARIPRKFLFRNGARQFLQGLIYIFTELHGTTLFDMHTDIYDPKLLENFTEEGWRAFYRRVGELLRLYPNVKGTFGISWFFDPALKEISPRLAYLSKLVVDNGGMLFYNGMTTGGTKDAIEKSLTRRRLYEEGKYLPRNYVAFLSRRKLIAWANSPGNK